MSNVIIRIELKGDPSGDTYSKLHSFMEKNQWSRTIATQSGNRIPLPHAMYSGLSQGTDSGLASALRESIESVVWKEGAIVMVIGWNSWAKAGT
jgi:hypothetical protein